MMWWSVGLYFSACGTRSGIVEFRVIYFSAHVESALILCNFMSYIFFCAIVGTTRSDIVKVRVTHFSSRVREKRSLILCNFGLYIFFRLCGTRSRIVESRVIYFFLDRVEWDNQLESTNRVSRGQETFGPICPIRTSNYGRVSIWWLMRLMRASTGVWNPT